MTTMNNEDQADPNVHEARGLDCGMNKPSNARLTAPDTAHRSDDER